MRADIRNLALLDARLQTPGSELRTRNVKSGTQDSGLRTQDSGLSARTAAEEFASLLLLEMLKSMRATLSGEGLDGDKSSARETYSALADAEVTRVLAKHDSMGLAHFLEQSLNRMTAIVAGQEASSAPIEGEVSKGIQ